MQDETGVTDEIAAGIGRGRDSGLIIQKRGPVSDMAHVFAGLFLLLTTHTAHMRRFTGERVPYHALTSFRTEKPGKRNVSEWRRMCRTLNCRSLTHIQMHTATK